MIIYHVDISSVRFCLMFVKGLTGEHRYNYLFIVYFSSSTI